MLKCAVWYNTMQFYCQDSSQISVSHQPHRVISGQSFLLSLITIARKLAVTVILVHAGLFCCFHSPPISDMDYMIFNMRM